MKEVTPQEVCSIVDHTELSVDASPEMIAEACDTAVKYGCASVCVYPKWVKFAAEKVQGTGVKVTTVIGFPTGTASKEEKVAEALQALKDGADEFDMVINVPALLADDYLKVFKDMRDVREATRGHVLKVILETATLTEFQIVQVCLLANELGIDYVKTSTGFHPAGGATVEAVRLMRETVPSLGVKASGGVRTLDKAKEMIEAGATRIGTSSTRNFFGNEQTTHSY